ncbi:hypothetical protein CUMW_170890 [Citrus unshiu]|nr:hypothetical protein CUMW_170890 [Citrus unshiu]
MPSGITARLPTLEDLEAYAIGQWEVFQRGLLIQRDKEAPRLTESGFQFLLMDTNAQLWIEYQLPNLIVGAITKESLYNAVENGLTAEQIRLWESDLNRVEMTPAHYYDEFPSRDVFEAACDYARDRSGLL